MRLILPVLLLLMTATAGLPAEMKPFAKSTNDLIITSEGPFDFDNLRQQVTFRDRVRVTDGQMLMTCELLTVTYQTNATDSTKIERIVAESNVVITQQQGRATGDLAIYTATNDIVLLIGKGVVQTKMGPFGSATLETQQGSLMSSNVLFDRKNNRMWAAGPAYMQLRPDAFGKQGIGLLSTNAFDLPGTRPRGKGTNAPPGRTR
jgi:lipopolysaccharide export system protein LptA